MDVEKIVVLRIIVVYASIHRSASANFVIFYVLEFPAASLMPLAGVAGETVCCSPFRTHFVHIGALCVCVELEHCYFYHIEYASR